MGNHKHSDPLSDMRSDDHHQLRIGDRVKLKDSNLELRGDVWQLRSGQYVVVRWEDDYRSTHAASAIELDTAYAPGRSRR